MSSPSGSGGAPRPRQYSLNSDWRSAIERRYSAVKSAQAERSSNGSPEKVGGSSGSFSSSGLHETIRAHGRSPAGIAGNAQTLSSTIVSGSSSSKISLRRSSTYSAPSMSACQVGAMNSASWSNVDLRNTGAVSRMKSFQNWPGSSSSSGGGARRIRRSSNPFSSSVPAKDSSITKTTR